MSKSDKDHSFQLKADFFPVTVLKISRYDIDTIGSQLRDTIEKAPNYLTHAPILIDLDEAKRPSKGFNLEALCATLRAQKIFPVGIRGLEKEEESLAFTQGLAVIQSNKVQNLAEGKVSAAAPIEKKVLGSNTKIITKPIRSGTQVYAKGCDLLILSGVNAGAECIADGHIYVYGPLRGRALAGASGDTEARIFCASLEAELIAIAGHYLIKDQIKVPKANKPMLQIFLQDDNLIIDGI